jgi:hypothetical protein
MRPVSVFANGPASEIEQLEADLHGRWRQATRAVMVLLSPHGLPPAQIAALLDCHRYRAPLDQPVQRRGDSRAGGPAAVRAAPAGRAPADRADRRAAGPPRVTWPGRLRQIHSFFRNRSPGQMLATAAPWTSPWLPPGYEQNFWNAA